MSYRGPLAGLLASVLTTSARRCWSPPLDRQQPLPAGASVELGLLVGIVGTLTTFWLTLPIGAVSGWIHERAVTEH